MRKISLFAIAAAFILAGIAGWVTSTIGARGVNSTTGGQIDTLQLMTTAKDLPTHQYDTY